MQISRIRFALVLTAGASMALACAPDAGGAEVCETPESVEFVGETPCLDLSEFELATVDALVSNFGAAPTNVCAYEPEGGDSSACGTLDANNAFYCPADDTIAWDVNFLDDEAQKHGEFAVVVTLAHEWGHLLQERLGSTLDGIDNELHADCIAGVFTGIEEFHGFTFPEDICAAFASQCAAGDPEGTPWFSPDAHGTCAQREDAFEDGYQGAIDALDSCASLNSIDVVLEVCGV